MSRAGQRTGRCWVRHAHFALLLLTSCSAIAPLPAWSACSLVRLVELPVTMRGLKPLVQAGINGKELRFIADSGAFYSMLTPAAAAELKLHLEPAPPSFHLVGVGGETQAWLTTVKTFNLVKLTVPGVVFLVAGNDLGNDVAGVIGQNLFHVHDVEYDLANGVIRIFKPEDCKNVNFAYWAKASGQPVSQMDIEFMAQNDPHTAGVAYVNGARIRVWFDSGADVSTLSLGAAKRAGITPESPGVTPGGASRGIGQREVRTWIAPVESFRIGDEEVQHTHLRIAERAIDREHVDMLLGADFFLSHRIYVANSERKIFFTYNGGPVFNLTVMPAHTDAQPAPQPAGDATAAAAAADAAAAAAMSGATQAEPTEAAGYARRGSAFAARRDYGPAIADLNRACELAPAESAYFYQRGLAHLGNREPQAALSDFDQAIKLKPDDVPSLLERTRLHAEAHQAPAVLLADLDAADRAAPRESDERIALGNLYQVAGNYPAAVSQYSQWIDGHEHDVRMAEALGGRCWARAKWGQELEAALADCSAALRRNAELAGPHNARGLIYLRRADYERAIKEYDTALHLNPRIPWALYGRGVAKLRKGQSAEGQADMASASAIAPRIAEEAAQRGIQP